MDEGKPGRHDERPRARDNFDPRPPFGGDPKMVRALADDIFMDGKMQLHAGADTDSGLGPGLVPTSEASRGGDDIFAEGRARAQREGHAQLAGDDGERRRAGGGRAGAEAVARANIPRAADGRGESGAGEASGGGLLGPAASVLVGGR